MHRRFDAKFVTLLVRLALLDRIEHQEQVIYRYENIIRAQDARIAEQSALLASQAEALHLDLDMLVKQAGTIAQIVQAVRDLGVTELVNMIMRQNAEASGQSFASAPTLRSGDQRRIDSAPDSFDAIRGRL